MDISHWMIVLFCLSVSVALVFVWIRLSRPAKDDPRLSKGLQLLQSKIAVLEDLSDRTERQVDQMVALMEKKCLEIQAKIDCADKQLLSIDQSMKKSLEVAKIFQDKIPHEEIVERQNTIRFIKAARMAHRGASVAEIVNEAEISQAEAEFVMKVNRDQLMFNEEELPAWVKSEFESEVVVKNLNPDDFAHHRIERTSDNSPLDNGRPTNHLEVSQTHGEIKTNDYKHIFTAPKVNQESLKKLGNEFKKAVQNAAQANRLEINPSPKVPDSIGFVDILEGAGNSGRSQSSAEAVEIAMNAKGQTVEIRPFTFPRVDMP